METEKTGALSLSILSFWAAEACPQTSVGHTIKLHLPISSKLEAHSGPEA